MCGSRSISFAVVGAPTVFRVLIIFFQSWPWSLAIIIAPIPHFSPCKPIPGLIWSTACEKRCSEPEQGLLLPAIHEATPELINASTTARSLRLFLEKVETLSVRIFALNNARFAEYLPKYSPVFLLAISQSFTAVIFAIKSPQPLEISRFGAFFITSTSTKTPSGAVATSECGFSPLTETNGLDIPSWDADVGILTNGFFNL